MDELSITQLLILSRSLEGQITASDISKGIGITRQAVSYHLKNLKKMGYMSEENKITQTGVEFLYGGLRGMRDQISKTLFSLDNTQIWEALADSDLKKGDSVFLHMRDGFLHASLYDKSKSVAVCTIESEKGGITGVSSIQGIIPLKPSSVRILVMDDVDRKSSTDSLVKKIELKLKESDSFICTVGELAFFVASAIMKTGFNKFGSLESAFDAAQRGVGSVILVSRRRFTYESARLENLILVHPGVKINVEEI